MRRPEELQRVHVRGAAACTPVEAFTCAAVIGRAADVSDKLARDHRRSDRDGRLDRFITGTDPARVRDHEHGTVDDHAGEGNGAGCGRADPGAIFRREVDAAMSG